MPVVAAIPWILGGLGVLSVGAAGWKMSDEIGGQLDAARPYLLGLAALYVGSIYFRGGK